MVQHSRPSVTCFCVELQSYYYQFSLCFPRLLNLELDYEIP